MKILFMFFLLTIYISLIYGQVDTTVYLRILNGNEAGFYKTWSHQDTNYAYQWLNDRGRGDSIRAAYTIDDKGFTTWLETSGHDYFKNPFTEKFTYKNRRASWQNTSEDQSIVLDENAFYLPLLGIGGDDLNALYKNDGVIKLLPSGELKMEEVKSQDIIVGGKKRTLTLIKKKGFDLTPSYEWIDEHKMFFANLDNWLSVIKKDYESLVDTLWEIQTEEENKFYYSLAKDYVTAPKAVLLRNVNLFDSKLAKITKNKNVLLEMGIIKAVSDSAPSGNAEEIDCSGKTLLPGLIDMHVHLARNIDAVLHLVNGVTSVRDLGNSMVIWDFKEKIDKEKIIGPSIESAAALIDGKGKFAAPTGFLVGSEAEAVAMVDSVHELGFKRIKIYSSVKPEWVKPMVDKAKELGMKVSGHIPAFMTAQQAIEDGYDEIQHLNMLFLTFYGDTIDTRTPQRFNVPAKYAHSFNFKDAAFLSFIELLKGKDIIVDPTLNIFEIMFTSRYGKVDDAYKAIINRLPVIWQRYLKAGGLGLPVPEGYDSLYVESFQAFLKMVKVLYDNDIAIVAGTDGFPGFTLHRELELYVKAGIPANKVLQIATYRAASILNKEKEIGRVAKGMRANLVLIDGNPVENISDIRKISLIIKDGKLYDIASLLDAISLKN